MLLGAAAVHDDQIAERLKYSLTSLNPFERSSAAHAIGYLNLSEMQPEEKFGAEVTLLLEDRDLEVKYRAIQSLGRIRYAPALEKLEALIGDGTVPSVFLSGDTTIGEFAEETIGLITEAQ